MRVTSSIVESLVIPRDIAFSLVQDVSKPVSPTIRPKTVIGLSSIFPERITKEIQIRIDAFTLDNLHFEVEYITLVDIAVVDRLNGEFPITTVCTGVIVSVTCPYIEYRILVH